MDTIREFCGGIRVEVRGGDVIAQGKTKNGRLVVVTICNGGHDAIEVAMSTLSERISEANEAKENG